MVQPMTVALLKKQKYAVGRQKEASASGSGVSDNHDAEPYQGYLVTCVSSQNTPILLFPTNLFHRVLTCRTFITRHRFLGLD